MENALKYAELFAMIDKNFDGAPFGKKVAQKIFYFFERFGLELRLRYGIHYYGPYSAKLDNTIHFLESEEYLSIDTSGITHIISLGKVVPTENILTIHEKEIAEFVISKFAHKSSYELEALATMDYVANSILPTYATDSEIINEFIEIKGDKFSSLTIKQTLGELKSIGLIAS